MFGGSGFESQVLGLRVDAGERSGDVRPCWAILPHPACFKIQIQDLGFRIEDLRAKVQGSRFGAQVICFGPYVLRSVSGLRFRVQDVGLRS